MVNCNEKLPQWKFYYALAELKGVRCMLLCILEVVEAVLEGVHYVMDAVEIVLEMPEVLKGMCCVLGAM